MTIMITELKGLIYIAIIFSKTHYREKGNYYHANGFIPDKILINVKYIMHPRTQALHHFYIDQWQLINAKRARVLGQQAKKPSAQGC